MFCDHYGYFDVSYCKPQRMVRDFVRASMFMDNRGRRSIGACSSYMHTAVNTLLKSSSGQGHGQSVCVIGLPMLLDYVCLRDP